MTRRKKAVQIRYPGPARRADARLGDGRAGHAHLPDHLLRFQRHRTRGQPVRPEGVGTHLHPHHEPDDRRCSSSAWRRWKGAWAPLAVGFRPGRGGPDRPDPAAGRGRDRRLQQALRRHLHRCSTTPCPAGASRPTSSSLAIRTGFRQGDQRPHQARLRRDHRQPAGRRVRPGGRRGHRPPGRAAAGHRQHLRQPYPVPALRARRGHRDPLARPSTSAGTARPSAASSSIPGRSTGPAAAASPTWPSRTPATTACAT